MVSYVPVRIVHLITSPSQYFREMILNEIRKARELYTGVELAAELGRIQQRLDNMECLSSDIVINLLLSYRDIQVCSGVRRLLPRVFVQHLLINVCLCKHINMVTWWWIYT